jgi:hypothetical protein
LVRVGPSQVASEQPTLAALAILLGLCAPVPVASQTVEIVPFGGYRFGGDLFELAANHPLDIDGAPVVGGALNIEMGHGLWFEGLFTRQQASVTVPGGAFGPPVQSRVVVDQWLAGSRQEFGEGPVRPFLTGLLGLTRYGTKGDNEVRFAIGAGGGVKLPLQRRLGLRLDGRLFTTFVDVDARAGVCTPRICVFRLNVNVAWQAEFTADLVVAF